MKRTWAMGPVKAWLTPAPPRSRSELSPKAGLPVAGNHRQRHQKLGEADSALQRLVPSGASRRHHAGELKDGRRKAQDAEEESDQDQPESPSPPAENPEHQEGDQGRKRNQKGCLNRAHVTGR